MIYKKVIALIFVLLCTNIHAQEFHSGTTKAKVIELFTSEGCSSCPPAEHWLATLKSHPKVFTDIIPLAFHVDYWDYIGWKDRFASPEYSQRQRNYNRLGHIRQVYTPGFVVDNKEWRSWFSGSRNVSLNRQKSGELDVSIIKNTKGTRILNANYSENKPVILNVAYLGMGITSKIGAGENRNRTLAHEFVVLEHFTLSGNTQWKMTLSNIPQQGQEQTAIAIWISTPTQEILQAVGGYLNE